MNIEVIKEAAKQFWHYPFPLPPAEIHVEQLGNGLINHTYRITDDSNCNSIVLQAINTHVFPKPYDILFNYLLVYDCLKNKNGSIHIPPPIAAANGNFLWVDDQNNHWRATAFIKDSYAQALASDEKAAFTVANCFATFTGALSSLPINAVKEIIPDFHNLIFRNEQFERAVENASVILLSKATHIIAELRQKQNLVDFFQFIQDDLDYPNRVVHHDCKITNILFDKKTDQAICPVDMDTIMPGKFFSDPGDMIRTMACTVDENSADWEAIEIRPAFYKAILAGYLKGMGNVFSVN
ncbi:MAG TPA: phosphotransferase, partial [Puia sp.]|nr:phosphotransferase [Puia sp.]